MKYTYRIVVDTDKREHADVIVAEMASIETEFYAYDPGDGHGGMVMWSPVIPEGATLIEHTVTAPEFVAEEK